MPYTKTSWNNGRTPLNATNLNHMESQYDEAMKDARELLKTASGVFVNVKDFGATGNGGTDDTAACQAALDTGGTVYFPSGVYLVDPLYAPDNTHVTGDGDSSVLVRKAATVSNPDSIGVLNFHGTSTTPYRATSVSRIKIDANKAGITVDTASGGDPYDQEGVSWKYCINLSAFAVNVVNSYSEGFDFDDCTDGMVIDCSATDCGGGGVHFSNGSVRMTAIGFTATRCGASMLRGGLDSYSGSVDSRFESCRTINCYIGFNLNGVRPAAVNCYDQGSTSNNFSIAGSNALVASCTGLACASGNGITVRAGGDKARVIGTHIDGPLGGNCFRVLSGPTNVIVSGCVATNPTSGQTGINHQSTYGLVSGNIGTVSAVGSTTVAANNVAAQ